MEPSTCVENAIGNFGAIDSHFTHGKRGRKWPRRGFILNRGPAANYDTTATANMTVGSTVGSCWRQTSTRVLSVVMFSQVHKLFWKSSLLLLLLTFIIYYFHYVYYFYNRFLLAYTKCWLLISSLLKQFGQVKNFDSGTQSVTFLSAFLWHTTVPEL